MSTPNEKMAAVAALICDTILQTKPPDDLGFLVLVIRKLPDGEVGFAAGGNPDVETAIYMCERQLELLRGLQQEERENKTSN